MTEAQLPIARPGKIICVGLNYRDHAAEGGVEVPNSPVLFAKWPSALIGPGDPIVIPEASSDIDFEGELAVLIGDAATYVPQERALEHVAGYLILNDVTARDLQASEAQWSRSKSFDTFGPVGPITAAADIPDPQQLGIRTWVNDELMQDGSTADMVFSVAELIAHISAGITLEPGDIIATGTPAGVGNGRTPPRFLTPGDKVRIEIDGLGTLENPVEAPSPR